MEEYELLALQERIADQGEKLNIQRQIQTIISNGIHVTGFITAAKDADAYWACPWKQEFRKAKHEENKL